MIITTLKLSNYRNYDSEYFNFEPGTNVLYGDNAQGKTNVIEAIFTCAVGKSYKSAKDKDVISFEGEEAHIELILNKNRISKSIDIHLRKNGKKSIAIDKVPIRKAVDLLGTVHVVIFSPEDLSVIKGSPAQRRNFIDSELCQLDGIYTHNLINYNKALLQKNALLKQLEEDPSLSETLPLWNEKLSEFGKVIIEKRRAFIGELSRTIKDIHKGITDGAEELIISYEENTSAEEFETNLTRMLQREKSARMSLVGPHRDDLKFVSNGIDLRSFGSQGQQRTAVLSLKLAEIEFVKKKVGDTPVLLLDDVLSELDAGRQKKLLSEIEGIQTIITCTGLDEFVDNKFKIDKTFFISKGRVTEAIL